MHVDHPVAEVFSPPYLFIDPDRRASITSIRPVTPPGDYVRFDDQATAP
ncbi:MAG TPA: hypothetical protein VGB66_19970 [Longimicrobium sp.]